MRNKLLAVVAAAGLIGCVGGIETDNPPPDGVGGGGTGPAAIEARKLFEDNVYSIIASKCVACHSMTGPSGNTTGFVGTDKTNAYVTAVGYQALVGDWTPSGAPIITKIAPGNHNAQTYDQGQKDKITAWLNKELDARAGGTTQPPGTTETPAAATVRLTREWSGCMTLQNFQTAKMKAWGTMRANNSACMTCHYNGEEGQIAQDVDNPYFMIISTNKYYMAQYFSVDMTGGTTTAKVIINTRSFTGVGQGLAPHIEHPRFNLQGSTGMTALQKFYDLTVANKTAGTCGAPTLMN